jgi:hypothetical protein
MKNYFNRPNTNVYIAIDDEKNQVVFINNSTVAKNILVITNQAIAYSNYIAESVDATKWSVSDETTFNTVYNNIASNL